MRIYDPVNLDILHHFAQGPDGITHIGKAYDGSWIGYRQEECDECGCACMGANSIAFATVPLPGLFVIAGLEPVEALPDELGANDDGDALCPACHADAEKAKAMPDDGVDGEEDDLAYDRRCDAEAADKIAREDAAFRARDPEGYEEARQMGRLQ